MSTHHLAQINIALPVAPLTSPELAGFVAALDKVNALADTAPGFVWRLQTEDGDATAIRAFDDYRLIVNMSVWTSVEALAEFVYRSDHVAVLRRRREWFGRMAQAHQAMWWLPAGALPTVADAERKLAHLRTHGSTPEAFTFREPFSAPAGAPVERSDDWFCPA